MFQSDLFEFTCPSCCEKNKLYRVYNHDVIAIGDDKVETEYDNQVFFRCSCCEWELPVESEKELIEYLRKEKHPFVIMDKGDGRNRTDHFWSELALDWVMDVTQATLYTKTGAIEVCNKYAWEKEWIVSTFDIDIVQFASLVAGFDDGLTKEETQAIITRAKKFCKKFNGEGDESHCKKQKERS